MISVVIPTYNEVNNIKILIKKLENRFSSMKVSSEIIIIDDNSPDGTAKVAASLNKKYGNIITIVRKKGKGFARSLYRGLLEAKGDYILCMDADLVHDPNEIPKMIKLMNKYDVVIGSRYLKKSVIKRPMFRNVISKTGQYIQKIVLGLDIKDTTNNFRFFKKRVFTSIKKKLHTDGNVMLFEFIYLANKKGFRIAEIPIKYLERTDGESKLSATREGYHFIKRIIKIKLGI